MNLVRIRFAFALGWLLVGIGLLLREWIVPPDILAKYNGQRLSFAGWFAIALAGWNGVRAFRTAAFSRPPATNPLRPTGRVKSSGDYHPEFDFNRPTDHSTGGKPSTSTD